jgi:hypothetical protein
MAVRIGKGPNFPLVLLTFHGNRLIYVDIH